LDRRPRQLSGGQRQRVALARAIVRDPAAFLMDEPLSNLDARLRLTMRGEIKRLCQRLSATTIYVTHDQVEALTMADLVAVMHGGELQQMAPPIDIYDQ
ncbi:ATP-binding cassette domain-containing protein, partial [Mesorhizobium sp. M1D.F.Ca.ET.184.01.1.1]